MSSNQLIPHNRQPTVIDSWVAADQMEKKRKIKKEKKKKKFENVISSIFDFLLVALRGFIWFLFLGKLEFFIRDCVHD